VLVPRDPPSVCVCLLLLMALCNVLGCRVHLYNPDGRRAYRQASSALPFVPMSVESFGRLWIPALMLLGDLAAQAVQAGGPGLSRATFISGALWESPCRSGAYVATQATGRALMCGLARPSTEVV
jgi:hypothetical protein